MRIVVLAGVIALGAVAHAQSPRHHSLLGVGSELAFGSSDNDLIRALQLSTQSTTNRAGQRLVERYLNVQPTITVRPGWPLRVIVHKDMVFR